MMMEHKVKAIIHLTRFYFILVGLAWISYYIYLRFILSRIPTNVGDLANNYLILSVLTAIVFIGIHLYNIKYIIYDSKRIIENTTEISQFTKLINFLYWTPLQHVYDLIAPKIPYSAMFFMWFTQFLGKIRVDMIFLHTAILFDYIPRLLITWCFLVDVIVYKDLFHFYAVINYISIPIMYRIILKLYADTAYRNYYIFNKYFDVEEIAYNNYKFKPKDGYPLDLELRNNWISIRDLQEVAVTFQKTCSFYGKPIFLISSISYLISWSYYLYLLVLN